MSYRFRVDDGKLVLQVQTYPKSSPYYVRDSDPVWRDATVEDIPVADPFPQPVKYVPANERAWIA